MSNGNSNDPILITQITNYNLQRRLSTLVRRDIETAAKISILNKDREPTKNEIKEIFEKLSLRSVQKPNTSESSSDGWKATYQQTVRTSLNRRKLLALELVCPCCGEELKGSNKIITPEVLEDATDVSISRPFVKIFPSKKEEGEDNGD